MKLVYALLVFCLVVTARCEEDEYLDEDCAAKAEEISALTGKLATAEAQAAQLQGELERSNGFVQQMKTYGDTIRGQLEAANAQVAEMEAQKEAAVSECYTKMSSENSQQEAAVSECQRDLSAATGARTELDKQLRESSARIQLLTSDLKKQSTDNAASVAEIAELKETVASLQAKLDSQSWTPAWVMEAATPVLNTVNEVAGPYIQTVTSSAVFKDAYGKAKQMTADAYEAAQPLLKQAKEKAGEAYVASQPAMKEFSAKSQEAYAVAKEKAGVAYTAAQAKAGEIMESETVANLKSQSTKTIGELKSLLKTQMQSIPSLAPYANPETIDLIVYAILGLPLLFLFSLFAMCCGRGGKKSSKPAETDKSSGSGNKGKKRSKQVKH